MLFLFIYISLFLYNKIKVYKICYSFYFIIYHLFNWQYAVYRACNENYKLNHFDRFDSKR